MHIGEALTHQDDGEIREALLGKVKLRPERQVSFRHMEESG